MATITPIKSASKGTRYRAQIRKFDKGTLVYSEAKTFSKEAMAKAWARRRETELEDPAELQRARAGGHTVGDLLALYIRDFGDGAGRSKLSDLKFLQRQPIAQKPALSLTSEMLVDHVRERLDGGAQPQTVNNDLVWLRVVFQTAKPAWNIPLDTREIDAAKTLCRKYKLIGRSKERRRRPTREELRQLSLYFADRDGRARIPMLEIMWFAIHSGRREDEICRLRWEDNHDKHRTGVVRDLKHPRKKEGNHQRFKYTEKAWAIAKRQPRVSEFIFPYNSKSVGAAFTRACKALEIDDLTFHDLRHEATSRLFESPRRYSIPEVMLFTLHKDVKVLMRYVNLRPEDIT